MARGSWYCVRVRCLQGVCYGPVNIILRHTVGSAGEVAQWVSKACLAHGTATFKAFSSSPRRAPTGSTVYRGASFYYVVVAAFGCTGTQYSGRKIPESWILATNKEAINPFLLSLARPRARSGYYLGGGALSPPSDFEIFNIYFGTSYIQYALFGIIEQMAFRIHFGSASNRGRQIFFLWYFLAAG